MSEKSFVSDLNRSNTDKEKRKKLPYYNRTELTNYNAIYKKLKAKRNWKLNKEGMMRLV